MADDGNGGFAAFMAFVGDKAPAPEADQSAAEADGYHYEEEQEREAMMKSYHHPMKLWYRQQSRLQEEHGAFPLFWQDLKAWKPYRDVLKAFIKDTDQAKSQENGDSKVKEEEAAATTETVKDEAKAPEVKQEQPAAAAGEEPPKRRRKSRWGDPTDTADAANGEQKRKKSRWAPAGAPNAAASAAGLMLSQQQQQAIVLRATLDSINQKLVTVVTDAARIEKDPNRSPSPPPQYDANGKRTNTREVRMKAALEKQRNDVIESLVKVNPLYRPPADYQKQKLFRKIYIPIKEYPSYNFIGLIIGPRGNTQKRMEKETNCKIAIRGRGSVKEGSKGKKMQSDENDDLHVLITGEKEDELDRAAKEVASLLVPVDDTKNSHKQKQLRELALINGTLRDDDFCHVCGEKGHRQWECPNREQTFKAADVKCSICGDSSHPTSDCTQKNKTAAEKAAIDEEYNSFMQQLGEKPVISTANKPPPTVIGVASSAPWLKPSTSTAAASQPWMTQKSAGAPGTTSVPPPPGVQVPIVVGAPSSLAMGSTPATAYPPPMAPGGAYNYPAQTQAWDATTQQQWAGYNYYGSWDQSATAEYQYGQYAAQAGAAPGATVPGAADPNQYPQYQSGAPPS